MYEKNLSIQVGFSEASAYHIWEVYNYLGRIQE